MNYKLEDFFELEKGNSKEEKELLNLTKINLDLYSKIGKLKEGNQVSFYDELILQICSLKEKYIMKNQSQNNECSPSHKFIYLFYELYNRLLGYSFMNKDFLMNFLYKTISLNYEPIDPKDSDIKIINDSISQLCKTNNTAIIKHCLNLIVNKYIFKSNWTEYQYLLNFFKKNIEWDIYEIRKKTSEIFLFKLYAWKILKIQKIT